MHPLEPWDEMPDHQHGLSKTFYKIYTPQLKYVEYIVYQKCSESKQKKNNRRDTWYMQKTVLCSKKYWRTLWVGRNSLMGPIPHSPSVRMRNCSPHVYISVINVYPSPKAGYDWNCPFFFSFLSDMQWGINVSSVSGLFWLLSFDYMVRFWSGKKKRRKTKMYFYPLSMSKPSRVISVAMLLFYSCCETW